MATNITTTDASIALRCYVERDPDASNAPGTCLWCGRKLRRHCNTKTERTDKQCAPKTCLCGSPDFRELEGELGWFVCRTCDSERTGHQPRRVVSREPRFAGGARGDYGDNAFCGLRCGYAFGVTMATHGRRLRPSSDRSDS